ncbi:MAG: hypothetical protein AB7T49_20295 [Oligoflexales bacterium]
MNTLSSNIWPMAIFVALSIEGCNANMRIDSGATKGSECAKRPDAKACLEETGESTDSFRIANDEYILKLWRRG